MSALPVRRYFVSVAEGADISANDLFWALAEELMQNPAIEEGTMMGHRCLRLDGDFLAMLSSSDQLVVKLPAKRVGELVAEGVSDQFSPAGRVFKEWTAVADPDEKVWRGLLQESKVFVASSG